MTGPGLSISQAARRFKVRRSTISADFHAGRIPGKVRGLRTIIINERKAADLYGA